MFKKLLSVSLLFFISLLFTFLLTYVYGIEGVDFYKLLDVDRQADTQSIRKAYKRLALIHHPDKNQNPNSINIFREISRAYETLRDYDRRKRYDIFGEDVEKDKYNTKSHSRNTFKDDFNLYENDKNIINMNINDFDRFIDVSFKECFVKFYSPGCSHCHKLAPIWRALSYRLANVIHIAAVNCLVERHLCHRESIRFYPTLVLFSQNKRKSIYMMQNTHDDQVSDYITFVLEAISATTFITQVLPNNLGAFTSSSFLPTLIYVCHEPNCRKNKYSVDLQLVAVSFRNMVNVGQLMCSKNDVSHNKCKIEENSYFYFNSGNDDNNFDENGVQIVGSTNHTEIISEVLSLLPPLSFMDSAYFRHMLESPIARGGEILVHFIFGVQNDGGLGLEAKRVRALIPHRIHMYVFDCSVYASDCNVIRDISEPRFALFKMGMRKKELYYGDMGSISDVVNFVRLAAEARTMFSFSNHDLEQITRTGTYIVDFFAPWCPPCRHLLPEFRQASIEIGGQIKFITVDCSIYGSTCRTFGINSFPSIVVFNNTQQFVYYGPHKAGDISEFVVEVLRPIVISLSWSSFYHSIGKKQKGTIWIVDFVSPKCRPCQLLSVEWRRLAKRVSTLTFVKVASVDCLVEKSLCRQEGVSSYPTIRLYPMESETTNSYYARSGSQTANALEEWIFSHLPSEVVSFSADAFTNSVRDEASKAALIVFFAPWCGHCRTFMPIFEKVARGLKSWNVIVGKINCEHHTILCRNEMIRAYPTVRFYDVSKTAGTLESRSYTETSLRIPDKIIKFVMRKLDVNNKTAEKTVRDEL